jgi:radical SAM superfamily enzyme YgiQ (UPF0313 family)
MRILLTTLNAKYIHTNLAIRLLYSLNQKHNGLKWKEFTIKESIHEVANECATFELVAFSCYIWNITQTLVLIEQIKELNPNIKILLAGPEVSYEYDEIIKLDSVDYIIVGEGEIPFSEFIESYPNIEMVPSLVRYVNEKIIVNPSSPPFNLNNYQDIMPYGFDDITTLKNKVLYIETSRGCPYKCEFCLASLDNKIRYLPDKNIKETLLFLMQNGKVIKFLDRTFNIKKDFTLNIFDFILKNYKTENVFQFEITADILHPDIINFINENVPKGLFRFEIGIQTVNQKANLNVSRKQNFEKTKSIIKSLESKVEMHLDLIVGLAFDEWEDIKYSIEEVFKLFAPELQLGFLKFLKGTPVRDKHNQHGFVFDPNPPYQIIESKYLSKKQLEEIVKLEHALEIYWNGKKALNTLKYVALNYSIFDFLLELGKHFETQRDFHKYSLTDVFDIILGLAEKQYKNDFVMKELIALDYYLHFKVKPKKAFLFPLEKKETTKILVDKKINPQKFRHLVLPLSFDFQHFMRFGEIIFQKENLIIQYTGTEKAAII